MRFAVTRINKTRQLMELQQVILVLVKNREERAEMKRRGTLADLSKAQGTL